MEIAKDDFADFVLRIDSVSTDNNGDHLIRVADSYEGREVGIEITIPSVMRRGLREEGDDLVLDKDAVYYNGVRFVRLGLKSDTLLAVIASAYGCSPRCLRIKEVVSFTCIVLEGDTRTFMHSPMKCKMFFDERLLKEENDEDYCEFYLNFDLARHTLEIAEKDQEYRPNIVRAFYGDGIIQ